MATNLALDDRLIEAAKQAGNHRTKRDAVTAALDEYVARRKQQAIFELVGAIDFDRGVDLATLRGKPRRKKLARSKSRK